MRLKYLDSDNARRSEIAKYYREHITNTKIILPQAYDEKAHVWHVFVIRTKDREALKKHLEESGIQTNIHYPVPPHKQLAYKEWNGLSLPITGLIHREVISLPISPVLTDDEVKKVTEACNAF